MKLLAIDTATEACSAALSIDGEHIQRYRLAPRQHAELILPMVDELLREADCRLQALDALAFGRGPGAFTGLRIATGVAQGLAYAADLPVLGISSLATLAQSVASEQRHIIPAFDARMGEIYCALYRSNEQGLVELDGEEMVVKPEQFPLPELEQCFGIGSGWGSYHDVLSARMQQRLIGTTAQAYPAAEHLLPLAIDAFKRGQAVSAEQAAPVYLRNKVTF